MWECRACVLRCIRAVINDSPAPFGITRGPLLASVPSSSRTSGRRRLATTSRAAKSTSPSSKLPARIEVTGSQHAQPGGQDNDSVSASEQRAIRAELQYLKDPVKLAEHVHYTLRCNKPEKALELCRAASKSMDCVVSWNHTVDWHMRQGRANEAIKIYNEMKKRAQFPDSHTYMLLLRGFPQRRTHHGPEVKAEMVSKAVSIYNSMRSPNSKVKPSIMHTNAVLRVCSLAGDMDALWSVAGQIPDHSSGSADHITYSVLLGAIRHNALRSDESVTADQLAPLRQQAVQEGMRIWTEVVAKWRGGEVMIDEQLICEMGNLLLTSRSMDDWDKVLDLIQQTTNIERRLPRIGTPERHTDHVPKEAVSDETFIAMSEDSDGWTETPAPDAFKPVKAHVFDKEHPQRPTALTWAVPGNAMLSVIMSACTQMRTNKTAFTYWDLLVTQHGVRPDLDNFHTLLKLLSINRTDAKAATVVQQMADAGLELRNMTFRMAFASCTRNWKNANVMDSANRILDVMEKTLPYPDVSTLSQYLSLALKTDNGPKIVAALDRMDTFVHVLRSRVTYGADEVRQSPMQHLDDLEAISELLQMMVGVIDTLLNRQLVNKDQFRQWHARRSQLTQFVGRMRKTTDKAKANQPQSSEGKDLVSHRDARPYLTHSQKQLISFRKGDQRLRDKWSERRPFNDKQSEGERKRLDEVRKWVPAEKRDRLDGLSKWKVANARHDVDRQRGPQNNPERRGLVGVNAGFADSPAEIGMR